MFQKKSLGQNFLTSEKALREIIMASDISPEDTVLEVGPGEGVLTKKILEKKPKKLVLVEKDDRLIPILTDTFAKEIQAGVVHLVHGDILEYLASADFQLQKPYKIVANIPYYITGLILRGIFSLSILPEKVVLLVQKEVADRIVDTQKNNILRASVTVYGDVRRVSVVPKGAFVPAPSVDSAILCIQNIVPIPSPQFEQMYFNLVKTAFSHKRKKVSRNLEGTYGLSAKEWEQMLVQFNLTENTRPEEISTDIYKKITTALSTRNTDI